MKAKGKRFCIILLVLVVLLASSAMTAYGANKKKAKKKGKTKTKTVQVVASESSTWTSQSAIRTNSGTNKTVYRYNKDSVCTGYTNNQGTTSYTLNAAGFITEKVTKTSSAAYNRLSESPARINTGFLRPDFSFSPTYFPTF